MFGPLGVSELLFIFALALLIFGPRELPKIGRTLGKAMAEFRKASNELRRTLNTEMLEEELRQSDPRRALQDAASDLRESVTKAGAGDSAPRAVAPEAAAQSVDESSQAATVAPVVRAPAGQLARGDLERPEDEGLEADPAGAHPATPTKASEETP